MGKILPVVLLFAVLPLGPLRAAGPFTVNTTTDAHSVGYSGNSTAPGSTAPTAASGLYSLRSVIEYASTVGGSTTITLPAGTYNLSLGDLIPGTAANTTITINGAGAANTIIRQTQSGYLIFSVNINVAANVVFNVNNLTIAGGSENENDPDGFNGNGGAILAGGSSSASGNVLGLTGVIFSNNFCSPVAIAGESGGAVEMAGGGNLNVNTCTFIGNAASKNRGSGSGGAIDFDNGGNAGNAVISDSYFSNNIAPGGPSGFGGGALNLQGATGTFSVNGCTFANNSSPSSGASTHGGAIWVESGSLSGSGNRFRGNSATLGGAVDSTGTANLINNWWGANGGPNSAGADTTVPATSGGAFTFNPWLQLRTSISQNPLQDGSSATVTASFLLNSSGQSVTAASPLIGLPVTWTSSGGNLQSPQSTIQSSGTATATFVAAVVGTGKVEAQVDGIPTGDGNATVNITITAPSLPVFSSATNTTFIVGTSDTFQVQASGSPTWSESGTLPNGVTFNTASAVLGGTPSTGSAGVYPITFSAQNAGGTTMQNFTLTVDQQPSVTPPANVLTNAANGVCSLPAISFAASASGYPAPGITYQWNGSTITSPTTFLLGTNVVTCTATNSIGTNSSNFTVTVLPGAEPRLNVVESSGKVFVSWPTNFNCYSLQIASALAGNQWHSFSGFVGTNGGNFIVTNGAPVTNAFFRLAH